MNTSFQEIDNDITFSNSSLDILCYLEDTTCHYNPVPQSDAVAANSSNSTLEEIEIKYH